MVVVDESQYWYGGKALTVAMYVNMYVNKRWWIHIKAGSFYCMHCVYGGICGILGHSLSFMLTVVIFFRLFVGRARHDYTLTSMLPSFRCFEI